MHNCSQCGAPVGDWIVESALCTPCLIAGVPEPVPPVPDVPISTVGDELLDVDDGDEIQELDFS